MKFYKIVNPEGHHGMVFKEGINIDINEWNPSNECEAGGLYFAREDILAFLDYGTLVYEVEPIGDVVEIWRWDSTKFKAHAINIKLIGEWSDPTVFTQLLDDGANVHANNDCALRCTSRHGYIDIVKLLLEHGADVHAHDGSSLAWAFRNAHYDVVKLLRDHIKTLSTK